MIVRLITTCNAAIRIAVTIKHVMRQWPIAVIIRLIFIDLIFTKCTLIELQAEGQLLIKLDIIIIIPVCPKLIENYIRY